MDDDMGAQAVSMHAIGSTDAWQTVNPSQSVSCRLMRRLMSCSISCIWTEAQTFQHPTLYIKPLLFSDTGTTTSPSGSPSTIADALIDFSFEDTSRACFFQLLA
jgi:hypothetical protein